MGINSGEFMGWGGDFLLVWIKHTHIPKKTNKHANRICTISSLKQTRSHPLTQQGQQCVFEGLNKVYVLMVRPPRPGWYVARETLRPPLRADVMGVVLQLARQGLPSPRNLRATVCVKLRNKKALFLMSRNKTLNLHAKAFRGHFLS